MRRREFLCALGGMAAAWPVAARGQQTAIPVVGLINVGSSSQLTDLVRAFRQGLSETGYVEGRNVTIEYRYADGYDQVQSMAADLIDRQVAVIAAGGGIPSVQTVKRAATTIPIVFAVGADPVAFGLVDSLNRPGGNLTGVTNLNLELGQKRLEILHEAVPDASIVALLINPATPLAQSASKDVQEVARSFGLQVHTLQANSERDIQNAFATLAELRGQATCYWRRRILYQPE
jgi:putative tryptophan/tyrosine transport system substrate-binding protein